MKIHLLFFALLLFCTQQIHAAYTPPIIPTHRPVVTLTVDGGGVRAIVPTVLIDKIEKHLDKPITEIADVFGGTSAGAIVTSTLLIPDENGKQKNSASDVIDLFIKLSSQVFVYSYVQRFYSLWGMIGPLYSDTGLLHHLQEVTYSEHLERHLTMTDLCKPILITMYKAKGNKGVVWLTTSFAHEKPRYNFKVWQALRATSAAPTFFTPYEHLFEGKEKITTFVDGAMFATNPDHETLTYAQEMYPDRKHFVISLSTGFDLEPVDLAANGFLAGSTLKVLLPFIRFMFQGQQENSQLILTSMHKRGIIEYHRIHIDIPEHLRRIDDGSLNNLEGLQGLAETVAGGEEFQNLLTRLTAITNPSETHES